MTPTATATGSPPGRPTTPSPPRPTSASAAPTTPDLNLLSNPQERPAPVNRDHLPAAGERPVVEAAFDVRDQRTPFPGRQRLRAPEGAPNVLLILIDDMGF